MKWNTSGPRTLLSSHAAQPLGLRVDVVVLGTNVAIRCLNSSGRITKCVVPSRQRVLSLSTTWPAALVCTRSLASAGRVM